ncbi:MAG TPA: HAMP domain-containing protein [Methanoregulaceae archaeon]|nr:MAG: HAMP domain-containing protein [Methanolinea sp.]HON80826.1 HAMP domain-containing protein [Methanoregulaceae archaeon]HPD09561.1 HAMP domain-containing protein [Methanoregulaceae archaeon]HRT15232.1 HAMP domain-containing protein [Methanoregulaceae archaeon]HRU30803.1 HAMP domain-containing protein [Methanoregulaceae archaeon]
MEKSDMAGLPGMRTVVRMQIPIFYKMMISMLFVAVIPILLLSIVTVGGVQPIITVFGIGGTIVLITLITLIGILICSYHLSTLIARPIVQLSQVADELSRGIVREPELPVARNDEIGTLSRAFSKMVNTYRLLDTLAQDQQYGSSHGYVKE